MFGIYSGFGDLQTGRLSHRIGNFITADHIAEPKICRIKKTCKCLYYVLAFNSVIFQ